MDATVPIVVALAILTPLTAIFGAFFAARQAVQTQIASAAADVQALLPEARTLLPQLKTEAGRARALLKKAGTTKPDDEDFLAILDHPMAAGIVRGAGIDPMKLKAGDAGEIAKVQQLVGGKQPDQQADAIFY